MPPAARSRTALAAVLVLLAASSPAHAGFITYAFTSDSSERGGSLAGSFQVDQAALLDGILSTGDVQNYAFTFTDPTGGTTHYALSGVFPDLTVNPVTGVPTGLDGSVLGDQVGGHGLAQAFLTPLALSPNASPWVAITQPTGEVDGGLGRWVIAPAEAAAVPAPGGAVLALGAAACLTAGRLIRRRKK